jgi:glycosyltransferase involved in cell wall biosynthesis
MLGRVVNSRKKKIVWVSSLILDLDHHKTTQIEVLQALARRGYEVNLVASYSREKNQDELSDVHAILIPLRYIPLLSAFFYAAALLIYLPLLFLRLKPDFVIIEPNPTSLSLAPIFPFPKASRPKIVLDIRTTPVSGARGHLKVLFFGITLYIAKRYFQGITIITDAMKKEVCKKYELDPKLVGVWTSGVSPTLFKPERYSRNEIRSKLGLEDRFVVFYHGAFSKTRGIIETVKGIKELKNDYPEVVLFLLGTGSAHLKEMADELGIQKMFVAHNSVAYQEVPKYIAMSDVGIVPLPNLSDWRFQCPLNLLEYLAMKKVVIATDIPANREVLGNSKCGIYVSSVDPKEIAQAIVYAYENRERIPMWGSYGRTIVEERYTWAKVAENFDSYLSSI